MSKRSRKFKGKVHACRSVARTGGIVAVASMAIVSKGYGIGIRYQENDHIPPGEAQRGYDIDQDGDHDIFFDTIGLMMEAEKRAFGGGEITCHVFTNTGSINVMALSAGEWIPPAGGADNWGLLGEADDFYNQPSPRYAGFTFLGPDSLEHYGWAELRVTGSLAEGRGLDVVAFGYETEPSTFIQAGLPLVPIATKSVSWGQIKALYGE
jgi:hypothetical protein